MSNEKLSKESAEKELQKFYDYYEVEKDSLNQEQLEALESVEPVVLKGIQNGFIEFESTEEKGFAIIQKLRNSTSFTYKELNGEAKMAMGAKSDNDSSGKCYALLGSLSSEGEGIIKKLKGPDLKRAEHIGAILLFC